MQQLMQHVTTTVTKYDEYDKLINKMAQTEFKPAI
jgi:hypothetical protein